MKRPLSWLFVTLLFISCGGGDDGAGPGDGGGNNATHPTPTTPGTPTGTATTQSIGAAGGTVTSADGLFSVTIPPGALPASPPGSSAVEAEITIQPITNTAWGGVGSGYRLLPDGLTFAAQVELHFSLEDSLLWGSDTTFVDVARQKDDGVWGILKNRSIDWESRTLTCTTSHFSDYSMIEGLQIRPASAAVATMGTVDLAVLYCVQQTALDEEDNDLVAVVYSCSEDDALAPLGTFSNWSVNGAQGGSALYGGVVQTGGNSARYTAPHDVPPGNPVAVSVKAKGRRGTTLLVSNITIANTWSGYVTMTQGGAKSQAFVTWTRIGAYQGIETYRPSGYVTYTPEEDYGPVCTFVSMEPRHADIEANRGALFINSNFTPAMASGYGMVSTNATTCFTCEGWTEPDCSTGPLPGWFAADSLAVSADGKSIYWDYTDNGQLPPVHTTISFSKD